MCFCSMLVFTKPNKKKQTKPSNISLNYLKVIDEGSSLCQFLWCLKDIYLLCYGWSALLENSYLACQDNRQSSGLLVSSVEFADVQISEN